MLKLLTLGLFALFCIVFSQNVISPKGPFTSPQLSVKSCDFRAIRRRTNKLMSFVNDLSRRFPETVPELQVYCRETRDTFRFIKSFAQTCLDTPIRNFLTIFSYSFSRANKPYCVRNSKKREELFSIARCGNPNRSIVNRCYQTMLSRLAVTNSIPRPRDRFPYICCTVNAMKHCLINEIKSSDVEHCNESAVTAFANYFNHIIAGPMNSICSTDLDHDRHCSAIMDLPEEFPMRVVKSDPFAILKDIMEKTIEL